MNIEQITNSLGQLGHNEYFQEMLMRASEINHPLFWIWLGYVGLKLMSNFEAKNHIASQRRGTIFESFVCTILQSIGFWLVLIIVSKLIYIIWG